MDPLLQTYDIYQLKAIANDLKITPCGDRRKRETWIQAIRKAERIAKLAEVCCEPTDKTSSELEAETAKVDAPPKNHKLKVLTSNKSDEHYTPKNIIDAAREVMGEIDLDPMSCERANKTVRAAKFYSKKDDSLVKPWSGRIWLNPAFSLADEAVQKLLQSYMCGVTMEAILLIKAAPDTARHQMLAALPFCEVRGRLKFIADNNNHPAPFAVLIFYLGKNFPKFREVFSKFGNIRLGTIQVDELEKDRQELSAKVMQLELQLAKKSEASILPDRRMDWLEDSICDRVEEAESRLKAFDIDCDIPRFQILSRQRIEWTAKLEILKSLQKSIDSINVSFFDDRQIERPPRKKLEEIEGWRSEFSVGKLVQSGDLVTSIKRYSRIKDEWIAICRIRAKGENYAEIGREFYLRTEELLRDFVPYESIEELLPYRLGSIRTTKELKSIFRGLKIPTTPSLHSELLAPDKSIWQAFRERNTGRCAIKWCCEVLPNGDSRSPRIPQKNDRPKKAATNLNSFVKYA
jgi:DNA N-6-adenine-methyltransferase (Dam)